MDGEAGSRKVQKKREWEDERGSGWMLLNNPNISVSLQYNTIFRIKSFFLNSEMYFASITGAASLSTGLHVLWYQKGSYLLPMANLCIYNFY